jgi:hypothetical protein
LDELVNFSIVKAVVRFDQMEPDAPCELLPLVAAHLLRAETPEFRRGGWWPGLF